MEVKKILFGCAVTLGGLTTSLMADNYCCAPQFDNCCQQDCCTNSFDGFYVGGNLGVLSHLPHRNDFSSFSGEGGYENDWSTSVTSFTAGLQLGYDWQCSSKLLGLVIDWNWTNSNRHDIKYYVGTSARAGSLRDQLDWFTTIRARAGLTVCDALIYVTAGAAVADFKTRWTYDDAPPFFQHRHNQTRWGWTVGVGTEFFVWCNWSVGLEGLVMNFSRKNSSFAVTTNRWVFGYSDTVFVARVLVNYRFGSLFGCGCR